ncbi:MAG: hypothetical protein QW420_02925 [Candidatus Caldarchaeum sp.]
MAKHGLHTPTYPSWLSTAGYALSRHVDKPLPRRPYPCSVMAKHGRVSGRLTHGLEQGLVPANHPRHPTAIMGWTPSLRRKTKRGKNKGVFGWLELSQPVSEKLILEERDEFLPFPAGAGERRRAPWAEETEELFLAPHSPELA